jgi:hypothetical protein
MAEVDAACEEVGRDPGEVERTAAVYVQMSRGEGRVAGSEDRPKAEPITGLEVAERFAGFEEAGLGHIQVVLDPIDSAAVEELASALGM